MPEEEFYGIVKMCDVFDLVWLDEQFTATIKDLLSTHRLITVADLSRLGDGIPLAAIESKLRTDRQYPASVSPRRAADWLHPRSP